VLISASRSAALGLVIVYVGLYLRLRNRFWPLHVVGLAGLGAAVVAVFIARNPQGLRSLDRFNFLQVFLWETRNWPIWEFVTGSYPLTPLSPGSCSRLASYTNEFSLSNTGACYSVILHSYLMRAAFDQGLLGLALLYVLVWLGLARSGAGRRDILVLLGVLTASGLSVSSFNNVFAVLTLAIAFGLRRPVTSAVLPAAWHRAPPAAPRDRGSQLLVGGATDSWVHPLVEARPQHSQQPAGRRNVVTVSSNPLHQSVDHVGPGKASFAEQELAHLRISIFIGCTRFSRRGRIRSARSSIKPLRATGIDVVVLHPPPRTRVPIRVPRVRLLP